MNRKLAWAVALELVAKNNRDLADTDIGIHSPDVKTERDREQLLLYFNKLSDELEARAARIRARLK